LKVLNSLNDYEIYMIGRFQPNKNPKDNEIESELEDEDYLIQEPDKAE